MTASTDDGDLSPEALAALDRACQEAMVGLSVADQRINQLAMEIFADPVYAAARLRQCLTNFGVDETVKILEGRSLHSRVHQFGLFRGLTYPRWLRSPRVVERLAELPEALRDFSAIERKIDNLRRARHELRQRMPGRAPLTVDRDAGTKRSRSR